MYEGILVQSVGVEFGKGGGVLLWLLSLDMKKSTWHFNSFRKHLLFSRCFVDKQWRGILLKISI